MSISPNEIRQRLSAFAREWKAASSERQQATVFWVRFFDCFGLTAADATVYEHSVKKLNGAKGRIDAFIPGKLMVEHKSRGFDLDAAYDQVQDYYLGLPAAERPRYLITSDFARIRLSDLATRQQHECKLADLPKRLDWFAFLHDDAREIVEENPINREAAYQISRLHEALVQADFIGRDLEIFLTRLLFCLFADDTGIFHRNHAFQQLIRDTKPDGSDTGSRIAELFEVLNQPANKRQRNRDERINAFPYVNGSLFAERTGMVAFDSKLRLRLIECAELDWSAISPAIFGAMFQGVLEAHSPDETRQATRRELGAHYTSERNILRVINPLFMDCLRAEYAAARRSKPKLTILYNKLPTLTFFDPACGCGNFLVVAYRELRRLEHNLIADLFGESTTQSVALLSRVKVSQFYGIEIEPSAAHIAKVALWITDHQLNEEAGQRFSVGRPTIPLVASPTIAEGNALLLDWASVLPPAQCSYVMGNPPFVGAKLMSDSQREQAASVLGALDGSGLLDFVACWYVKAAHYLRAAGNTTTAALVSTNSITQGEQVGVLWSWLLAQGLHIHFAHRTFHWNNEGKGNAAVHCVIVGFGTQQAAQCWLYDYRNGIKGEPVAAAVARINPYLVDAADALLRNREKPLCDAPEIGIGNKPIDGGNYLFTTEERDTFIAAEPASKMWFRRWLGADEFLNGWQRWCLWLGDCPPHTLEAMPLSMQRVAAVKAFRLKSKSEPTRKLAQTPRRFHVENIPKAEYLVIPEVSSERRAFIPIGYLNPKVLASNKLRIVPQASLFHFAVLTSTMHMAWTRYVTGRLKSDLQYSVTIVYNNFPWPQAIKAKALALIETRAQAVLDARAEHSQSTLAQLYDPLKMPDVLQAAHAALDKAVDAAYGYKGGKDDAARVAFLFEQYQVLDTAQKKAAALAAKESRKRC